jgi:thiol-disulfide isomerase/thioredoxin
MSRHPIRRRAAFAALAAAFVLAGCATEAPAGSVGQSSVSASSPTATATPHGSSGAEPVETDPILALELVDVRSGDTFTLGELAEDGPVLFETMAIWCTSCLSQQREVVEAHSLTEFTSVGIDVDPNERAGDLADYADREGFDWRFVIADAQLVSLLTDRFGFQVTNPPSTPTFVISPDGTVRALEFNRIRSAEELVGELAAG